MKNKLHIVLPVFIAILSLFAVVKNSYALNATIENNGAGSQNNINVSEQNQSNTNQSNTSNIQNKVSTKCDTGSNSANNNTGGSANVTSGDCQSTVNIQNNVNQNTVGGPTPKPSVTPKPATPPVGGPSNSNGSSNSSGGSSSSNGGSTGGNSNGQVLAATGVASTSLLYLLAAFAITLGLWQAQKSFILASGKKN